MCTYERSHTPRHGSPHTRAAWMIHVLSRLQLREKASWWCYPQMGEKKKKSHRRFERAAPNGGKWVVLCAPKSGMTFNEKGENKHNVENLESSKLSAAAHDCGVWWMAKKGKRSSNKEASIINISCVRVGARVCTTLELYFKTPLKCWVDKVFLYIHFTRHKCVQGGRAASINNTLSVL